MAFRELLQVDCVNGKNGTVPVASLEGKPLMLYFSAHWCPPCRGFTPKLAEFYKHISNRADIVFVSSDRDQKSFDEYYHEHPWLALPYADRAAKDRLSKHFKVEGIPTLVLLDKDGTVITKNAREMVDEDPNGATFPWTHLSANVLDIIGQDALLTADGKGLSPSVLRTPGSFFAIYYSAHWCPPCRGFTPEFCSVYAKVVEKHPEFHVVFASWDRDKSQFDEYFHTMPWAAFPFGDARIKALGTRFGVEGIPTVIMFDHKGNVVNDRARGLIGGDPQGDSYPWAPQPIAKVAKMVPNDDVLEALNEKICVLLNTNGASDAEGVTKEFTAAGNANTADNVQYLVSAGGDFHERVAGHLSIPAAVPEGRCVVLCFNLPNGRAKEVMAEPITAPAVTAFVKHFVEEQSKPPEPKTNRDGNVAHRSRQNGKYYCGKQYTEDGKCPCGHCDGMCGPNNGCQCPACREL